MPNIYLKRHFESHRPDTQTHTHTTDRLLYTATKVVSNSRRLYVYCALMLKV